MNLISYTITQIDEVKGLLYVTFVFDFETKEKRFDYRALTGYEEIEVHDVEETHKDKKGNITKEMVSKPFTILKHKHNFNLENPQELDSALKDWASAYIRGKNVESYNNQAVSKDVSKLIGKEMK